MIAPFLETHRSTKASEYSDATESYPSTQQPLFLIALHFSRATQNETDTFKAGTHLSVSWLFKELVVPLYPQLPWQKDRKDGDPEMRAGGD